MELVEGHTYFLGVSDALLRTEPSKRAKSRNHLLFGDVLIYLGVQQGAWIKVRSRGHAGWINKTDVSANQVLEVNFVDIGQGDGCHVVTPDNQIMLIDAGIDDNMSRFLQWRYNLRYRKVAGVDEVPPGAVNTLPPLKIDHVVISHPDKDHYYGFGALFVDPKVWVEQIYHNGIVERPIAKADKAADLHYYSRDDLGGYVKTPDRSRYLWDVISSNQQMHELIKQHPRTQKNYLQTLRKASKNNPEVIFTPLSRGSTNLQALEQNNGLRIKVLGPITEEVSRGEQRRACLRKLGNEGITKNGHSVVLQLQLGRLKVMLGGDLNTRAQDYLLQHYCQTSEKVSALEKTLHQLQGRGAALSEDEKQQLAETEAELEAIIIKGRKYFQVDITKACHHGSHDFSEAFLRVINAIATVVSSGDNESYAHPRPDALGSFGKYGRGIRPLIFSTELARSTKEFTHVFDYMEELKVYQQRLAAATSKLKKKRIERQMQRRKDSNVASYGLITLRTDGERVIMAQKYEVPAKSGRKWDIHQLRYNPVSEQFEYVVK